MARKGFWGSFSEGWRAVDPAVSRLNTYWDQQALADAYNTGARQDIQNVYGLAPEDARAAAQREADALTAQDAAEFGFDPSDPRYAQAAATQNVVGKQYGLGGKWQDTEFTDSQRRAAGLGAVADYYRKTGQIEKAMNFDQLMQAEIARDLQIKAAQNQLSDYEKRKASEAAAADQLRYLDQVQAARSNGALGDLFSNLRSKVTSGEISPEQYAAAVSQYRPENIARSIGSTVAEGQGVKAGLDMQQALHNQVKQTFMEEASRRLMEGDYSGLAKFFSDDSVYSDGKTYRFDGVDDKTGKVKFSQLDKDGKVLGSAAYLPEEWMAKIEAGFDPSKGIEYWKSAIAQKKADQQHAEVMARLGAIGREKPVQMKVNVPVLLPNGKTVMEQRIVEKGKDGWIDVFTGKPLDPNTFKLNVENVEPDVGLKPIPGNPGLFMYNGDIYHINEEGIMSRVMTPKAIDEIKASLEAGRKNKAENNAAAGIGTEAKTGTVVSAHEKLFDDFNRYRNNSSLPFGWNRPLLLEKQKRNEGLSTTTINR